MTIRPTTSARALVALVAVVGALAVLATGCGVGRTAPPDTEPTEEPDVAEDPDPFAGDDPDGGVLDETLEETDGDDSAALPVVSPAETLADGTHEGRLVAIDHQTVTLDLIEILSGDEALRAAEAAGALDPDGTLPNDVFVQELAQRVTLAIAGDGGFQVYDCSAGCALVGTTLDALVTGSGSPYGGAAAPFTFQVDGGSVISLVEVYLP
jgi:hypothetical protein